MALQMLAPFSFDWGSAVMPAGFLAVLAGVSAFYRTLRPDPAIAGMTTGLQQMILFTSLGAPLSYMIAAHGGPFWDVRLQQWDQSLGLDWRGYLAWVNARPLLGTAYHFAYVSLIPQTIAVIVGLGFARKTKELRIVVFAAILAGTITICLSGLTPAVSNFAFLGLGPSDYPNLHPAAAFIHMADLEGLRSGTLRTLSLDHMQGIITFPSYHAALATVFLWGFFHVPVLRWPGLIVATLTLLATPIDGGHYFVDVVAGSAIAVASLRVAHRLVTFDARSIAPGMASPVRNVFRSWPSRRSRAVSGQ
jgi:hypothetical protein